LADRAADRAIDVGTPINVRFETGRATRREAAIYDTALRSSRFLDRICDWRICNCGAGEHTDASERSNDFDDSVGECAWASRFERESPIRVESGSRPTIPSIRFTPPRTHRK